VSLPLNLLRAMLDSRTSPPVLISACLLGVRCRYDGNHSLCKALVRSLSRIRPIAVCPEQMGGLPTPREPANIIGGHGPDVMVGKAKCINRAGQDVTEQFVKGAHETLRLARLTGAKVFIGKERSPSCGLKTPYCEAPGGLGTGVTASLLEKEGISVIEIGPQSPFPTPESTEILESIHQHP